MTMEMMKNNEEAVAVARLVWERAVALNPDFMAWLAVYGVAEIEAFSKTSNPIAKGACRRMIALKARIASDLDQLGTTVTTARVTLERVGRPQLSEAQAERGAATR
jgi:hypothetical protein